MEVAVMVHEAIAARLQLLEIPSQNLANLSPGIFCDMFCSHHRNGMLSFPGVAPQATSAPTPQRSRATSEEGLNSICCLQCKGLVIPNDACQISTKHVSHGAV